jgi:hypothetical protein
MRAYLDESNPKKGRYRALAMISLPQTHHSLLTERLLRAKGNLVLSEMKWEKVRQARYQHAAERMLDVAVQEAEAGRMRADVLWWDTQDSRHAVVGRDDNAILSDMVFKLIRRVCNDRWSTDASWNLFPDAGNEFDWDQVSDRLASLARRRPDEMRFQLKGVKPLDSKLNPFIQLADLLAGVATFGASASTWMGEPATTCSTRHRPLVIRHFIKAANQYGYGISLGHYTGIRTVSVSAPINFWRHISRGQAITKSTTAKAA